MVNNFYPFCCCSSIRSEKNKTKMGFLLKEALKTLCGRNQWSYAVFWKIGCNNSKLLIWEECYYEPLSSWFSSESQLSQLGIEEEDRVCSLVNKMALNNSVSVVGQGMIGRAAFTGEQQWILLNNFAKDAYPPEVYAEMHHQFPAGMQTVAVIPVLPHGVVQLGSFYSMTENMGFVNDLKSLILQLGCIPGALLSEEYSATLSNERLAGPSTASVPLSVDLPVITTNCTRSVVNSSNQQSDLSHASKPIVLTPCLMRGEINNCQGVEVTPQVHNLNQISNNLCQANLHPIACQQENRVVKAEVIHSSLDSCLQQHSASHNAKSAFNNLSSSGPFDQSDLSDCSLKYVEQQITPEVGSRDHVNPCINVSSALNMSQPKTERSHYLGNDLSSGSTSLLRGIPIHGELDNLLRTGLITSSKSHRVSAANLSGAQVGNGLINDDSNKAGCHSLSNLSSESATFHIPLEGSDQKILPADFKFAPTDQKMDYDLLQYGNITSFHAEEHVPIGGQIPGLVYDCLFKDGTSQSVMTVNPKHEEASAQPPSGDDLFDVFGADFKNKLLNGNWNKLLADESDVNAENMLKREVCMNLAGMNSDYYSVNESIGDSGIFSEMGTDNLLDAVVSKVKPTVKQSSNDMSCTTLTGSSTSSIPSPVCRQVMSGRFQKGLFDFSKNGGKTGALETTSPRSGCSKDDTGNCFQTTTLHGSQLGSWVENAGSVKRGSSVSTGYSKRPDGASKSNRKRLKPGENPRPRPKDRQMIQDRVKELRDIVPNAAKCSIDALLERTIKHMLFLQSVTKHADKLKQTGESNIISKAGRLLLKDNLEGGATWALEVGSQSMVCPIIVEDLNPPRQMLVEMLCEEQGFFLEIADIIKGLGLTILKGVMEAHNDKIWARFVVEANRDVTRMEIFMSLVRLLDQTVKGNASSSNAIDDMMMSYSSFPQASVIPSTGRPNSMMK